MLIQLFFKAQGELLIPLGHRMSKELRKMLSNWGKMVEAVFLDLIKDLCWVEYSHRLGLVRASWWIHVEKELCHRTAGWLLAFDCLGQMNVGPLTDPCIFLHGRWERRALVQSSCQTFGHIWFSAGLRQKPTGEDKTTRWPGLVLFSTVWTSLNPNR